MGFAETFKALSNPIRRDILTLLKEGRLTAGDISCRFDETGATISHHLSQLKKAELISESKYKNYIYYELNTSVLEEAMLWLKDIRGETVIEKHKKKNTLADIDNLFASDGSGDNNI